MTHINGQGGNFDELRFSSAASYLDRAKSTSAKSAGVDQAGRDDAGEA